MVSLGRYIRGIRQVGIKEWWHQMQYIGDVKAGTLVGKDQYVAFFCPRTGPKTRTRIGLGTVILRT